jgi:hypothetical protein
METFTAVKEENIVTAGPIVIIYIIGEIIGYVVIEFR